MRKNYNLSLFATLGMCIFMLCSCCSKGRLDVTSPNGKTVVSANAKDGALYYSVAVDNDQVLAESTLGFELKELPFTGFEIIGVKHSKFDETWEQVWGEDQFVRNNYNEMRVSVKETGELGRRMDVVFRVFDDGFGFRYEFPEQENLKEFAIMNENTQFNFTQDHNAWWLPQSESFYESFARHSSLSKMEKACTPFTIEGVDGRYYTIHEANLEDYAKMSLYVTGTSTLNTWLSPWSDGTMVYAKAPFNTPWRTMIIADRVGGLAESRMMLNLNEPNKIEDTSWIKPCKYIGIWWELHIGRGTWYQGPKHGATTANTKKYMDFAAENGFAGVLVEGWNPGWEGDWVATSGSFSFTESCPDFDLEEITKYGNSKGVQLIGHHETGAMTQNYESQLDAAFGLCQKNGMHMVKTGNVGQRDRKEANDGQYAVRHSVKVIETAAKYQVCIDDHEPVMPTGRCRTWPNHMTGEGIRGQEHDAWNPDGGNRPSHATEVPFIRGLAGAMDYTFGTFNFFSYESCARVQTTLVKQLAQYVVIYSPMQMASDLPEYYTGKAFDFIRDVPTDWYESHIVDAVIGDYIITARRDRNSEDWYLGAVTDENARDFNIDLSFLEEGATYTAQIYADGDDADWVSNPTSFKYEEKDVNSTQKLAVKLATSGGVAVRFIKK